MSSDNENNLEAVAVSYSEEQFDPPSSSKRRRVDETNSLAADNDQVVRAGDEESGGGDDDERQRIHRPTRRSYNDALLLASLSNDEQVDEKEEPAAASSSVNVNALPSGDSEDNAISIAAADTHNTDNVANASSVDTPRRSNAISSRTSLQDVPSDKSRGGFILHPKPTPQDTPENNKSTAKKVTPDRMDARPSAASHHVMNNNNNPYPPPVRYPYYPPPYGHHVYHPPPYYSTHHRYPAQPPPPSIGTTIQSSPSAEALPLTEKSRESSSSQSHSPLPYHPLSHVPPPPPHPYEDHHAWGYYDQSRYHGGGGYYPPPPHHHQPASYGSYPPPTTVMQQQPTNNPTPTSTYPPSSHPTNTSTSPTRSVKPWVSMDENSPRIMYQPSKSEDPSGQAPGTPIIDEYHPSTTTHPPSYDYYGYNPPYGSGRSQEYSTPPAAYHGSSPSWDGGVGAVVPKTTFSPQLLGPTPHGVPPPPTTPMCTDGTNAKKHQFRKGMRGMHSDPVILRKKFSWRNYPELEEYLIANRTEYLRHSALNYTAEQKHFNNRLTEGLLELAARHNYIFDETCFNFVAVRDRIRCYYKSYVQSSKKRGIIVGFPKDGKKLETVE